MSEKSIKNFKIITPDNSDEILKVPLLKLNLHKRTKTENAADSQGIFQGH